jgi:LmbE family N-acetylglucosaminyl deacetylase
MLSNPQTGPVPTSRCPTSPWALFVFAHQDDEFGVFAALEQAVAQGVRPVCLYLTNGGAAVDPARRDQESRAVLHRLGVAEQDIHFLGSRQGIADGTLYQQCAEALAGAEALLAPFPAPQQVWIHAWEGGHQDHDAAHVIGRLLALRWPQAEVRQMALYHGQGLPGPLFKVLSPLPSNGPVQGFALPWGQRLRHLRLCWCYPSQTKTWVGLFPFVLLHALTVGRQQWQGLNGPLLPASPLMRPHSGPVLYESRHAAQWDQVAAALEEFLAHQRTNCAIPPHPSR